MEDRPAHVQWTSFESQQALYEQDLADDDSNFLGGGDHGATALELLMQSGCDEAQARTLGARLGVSRLLDRQYRHLSSGEARRVMVLRALASAPDLLVLDEPFEGLDPAARATLVALCARMLEDGQALMLLVQRRDDIPDFVTHIAVLRGGTLVVQGSRQHVLDAPAFTDGEHARVTSPTLPEPPPGETTRFDPVLRMQSCSVRYGEVLQFDQLDWTLDAGAHTLIVGENGCGKSTLLQLISGDHPQCYTNDLQVLGYQRGSGESIWDIKQHIGLVSPALHRDYRVSTTVLETVVSGLYDSIGIYRSVPPHQRKLALQWLDVLGMAGEAERPLHGLSYGQQRLILIARALIKQPPLLILDEPTQGLDDHNRLLVLSFVARLAGLQRTTMLFVSHRHDEHLPLFRARLCFERATRENVRYDVHVMSRGG
jgi:molybdate transport system ATP-binding protein